MIGEGPLFGFGVMEDGIELGIGEAGIDGEVNLLIAVVEDDLSFLKRKAAEGPFEVEMVKGDETGEGEVAAGQAIFDVVFVFEFEKKVWEREGKVGAENLIG